MSTRDSNLPSNVEPLLPSQARINSEHYLSSNLGDLTGISTTTADELSAYANERELEIRNAPWGNPVFVSDLLRVRNDQKLTLHPKVCQLVPENAHNQLLDDVVQTYYDSGELNPPLAYPEPVLGALNEGSECVYPRPRLRLNGVEYNAGEEAELRESSEYSIQVHDMLGDLRADGIVTNLGQSDCAYCGLNAGNELANDLIDEGELVQGYAGIDATSQPAAPELIVQSFDSEELTDADLVLRAYESARKHGIRSDLTVTKAEQSHEVGQ
jgi:hypothetical protein